MIFNVIKQVPKPKEMGFCKVAIDKNGEALLMDKNGEKAIDRMERARVEWMQASGIMISGFERTGYDRQGRGKFVHQEWFCRYVDLQDILISEITK